MFQKPILNSQQILDLIPDGASLLIGGFLGVGAPQRIIDVLIEGGRKNLTVITNDTARPHLGVGKLIAAQAVTKLYTSHIGTNIETQKQMLNGTLAVELVPQGTLVERIRAHGYGLGGVLTKTGLGTLVAQNKQIVEISGQPWLLDTPLTADFALVHSQLCDAAGNLNYAFTADNFNGVMAMAGKTVIAEVDQIVPIGTMSPDEVNTPSNVVDFLFEGTPRGS